MAKIKIEVASACDCLERSRGTDPFTEGWWYHGTTYRTAQAMLNGRKRITGEFWLTKNPQGASQCNGTKVLRCTVHLNKSDPPRAGDDRYNRKDEDEGLDQPYKWIGVIEGCVFLDKDCIQDDIAGDPQEAVPSAADELARLTRNANAVRAVPVSLASPDQRPVRSKGGLSE